MPILRRTQYTGRRPAYKAPPTTLEGMIIQWISEANCGVRAFLPDHERTTLTEDDEPACHLYVRDQRQIGRHTSRTHPKEHDLTITRVQYEADVQLRFQGAGAEAAARAFRLWMNTADAREKENQLGLPAQLPRPRVQGGGDCAHDRRLLPRGGLSRCHATILRR